MDPEAIKLTIDAINGDFVEEIRTIVKSKRRLYQAANYFEYVSVILIIIGNIICFATGFFNLTMLAFVSGAVTTTGIGCGSISKYCQKESLERAKTLRESAKTLNIENIPEIVIDDPE